MRSRKLREREVELRQTKFGLRPGNGRCLVSLVLGAGAFVALERRDREMWAIFGLSERSGSIAKIHGGVIAQVWRTGGGRQALLARAVRSIETLPLDLRLGQRAGALIARPGMIGLQPSARR